MDTADEPKQRQARGHRQPSRPCRRTTRRRRVGGAVILEVILALPVLAIVLMAVVEFGILLSNLQYLEFASRTGAQVASELNQTDFYSGPVAIFPASVLNAVNKELARTSIGGSPISADRVYIEHTVPAAGPAVGVVRRVCGGPSPSPCTGADVVDATVPNTYRYVRVTVFVDAPDLTPNLLATFGFDLTGSQFQQTTTFAYLR